MQIIRQIGIWAVVALIFLQTGLKSAIVVYYYANQSYIAQNLCEKRNEPKSCCAGSCQVNKWLKNAEEPSAGSTSQAPDLSKIKEAQLFFETPAALSIPAGRMAAMIDFPLFRVDIRPSPVRAIFHPPAI